MTEAHQPKGRALSGLIYLKDFALRTPLPVTPIPGNDDQERFLVSRWGCCKKPHPTLRRIVLWYLYGTLQDHLVVWECHRYRWEKANSFDHPESSLFV